MPNFSEKDFLKELLYCLEKSDLIKAKALLQYTPQAGAAAQLVVVTKINETKSTIAYPLMELLFEMTDLDTAISDKLYEMVVARLYDNPTLIFEAIKDTTKKNKAVYIKLAGDLKFKDAIPLIDNILETQPDKQSTIAALQSAGALKSGTSIPAILQLIAGDDPNISREAILAIADFDASEALPTLIQVLGKADGDTDIHIINAMARIKTNEAIETLVKIMGATKTDMRNAAMSSLIDLGEAAVPIIVSQLNTAANEDMRIHLITTLGHIGDVSALPHLQKILSQEPENPNIRFAIYEAMEKLPSSKSAMNLVKGLEDPVEQVRMAAAKAIDNNLSNVLVGGLKNIIESRDDQASQVVSALIDSGATNAFNTLIESDSFKDMATDYIAEKAHPDTRKQFMNILASQGQKALVEKIEQRAPSVSQDTHHVIYVVDDSKMMLKVYMKKLHEMGYTPITFEYPAEALKTITQEPPALLITDLNMPVINGLQLSRTVRSRFSKTELPILMITTQSDFIGQSSNRNDAPVNEADIEKAGVNKVLHKPFTDESLAQSISLLLTK